MNYHSKTLHLRGATTLLLIFGLLAYLAGVARAAPRMTAFDPAKHGFHFRNSFDNHRFVAGIHLNMTGRCGGMAYGALDYFLAGMEIPSTTAIPAEGSTLSTYLSARQDSSWQPNVDKWAELVFNPFGWRNTEFFNWGLQGFGGGRLQELRAALDAGRPVPLGLFAAGNGGAGPHHQVLAIGYDLGRYAGDLKAFKEELRIFIYDPNYPNETKVLRPDVAAQVYRYESGRGEAWMSYFVDGKYSRVTPLDPAVINRCSGVTMAGEDRSGRTLNQQNLRCANGVGVNFRGATAMQTDFWRSDLRQAIFYGANTRNSNFTEALLSNADFYGADVKAASFKSADLTGARFYGADLKTADLSYANVGGANLEGADLHKTTLMYASFAGSRLVGASLNTTIARHANFRGADLTRADLRGADFTGADFTGAILNGANRQGAITTGARGL